jgi:hypothetical protein
MHSHTYFSVLLSLALSASAAVPSLTPHKDRQCREKLKMTVDDLADGRVEFDGLPLDRSVVTGGAGSYYRGVRVDDAEEEGAGGKIFWHIPHVDPGCMVALIDATDDRWGYAGREYQGDIIIAARQEGCYYSNLPV